MYECRRSLTLFERNAFGLCGFAQELEGLLKASLELLWLTVSNGIPVFRDSFGRLIGVIEINTICLNDLGDCIATCTAANMVRVGAS